VLSSDIPQLPRFGARGAPSAVEARVSEHRRASLTRLGDVLKSALARLPVARELADHAVWAHWDAVVGPTIARHARPERLRRGVLVVAVDGSEWMQELQFLKHEVRERLNARLERPAVRDIFLVLRAEE
jgi:predicted nucleic acid-binding Zn ribbon protein